MKLAIGILYVDLPERKRMVTKMVEAMQPLDVPLAVFNDVKRKGPVRNSYYAMSQCPSDATHYLILQDDLRLCQNFLPAVKHLISLRPDDIMDFMVPPRSIFEEKFFEGYHYVFTGAALWTQAIVWPVPLMHEYMEFYQGFCNTHKKTGEDVFYSAYLRFSNRFMGVWLPGLVQHIGHTSLLGTPWVIGGGLVRESRVFIGADDPLTIPWANAMLEKPVEPHRPVSYFEDFILTDRIFEQNG